MFPTLQMVLMNCATCILYIGLLVTGCHGDGPRNGLDIELYMPIHQSTRTEDQDIITADNTQLKSLVLSLAFIYMDSHPIFKRHILVYSLVGETDKDFTTDANIAKGRKRLKRGVKFMEFPFQTYTI